MLAIFFYQVNKRCRFLLEFEQDVRHALQNLNPDDHPFGGQNVEASSLGWAMSAVSSRAFRLHGKKLPDGSHSDVPMMLPLIDMCNHSFNPNSRIVQEQDAGILVKACSLFPFHYSWNPQILNGCWSWIAFFFAKLSLSNQVVAETVIKQNESLVLNYGCLNNDLFLLDYGFVMPANPYDNIELKYDGTLLDAASMAAGVSSPNFSAPAPWQQKFLSKLNLDGEAPLLKVCLSLTIIVPLWIYF